MTDILQLPGWEATGTRTEQGEFIIEAKYSVQPAACLKCGVIGRLYKHGPKPITVRDSPVRGRPVRLVAIAQRYKCRECGGTFIQPLGGIQDEMRMTKRCVEYIQEQCLRDTFVRIAEHVGCDDKTVRNVAGDYIEQQIRRQTAERLGRHCLRRRTWPTTWSASGQPRKLREKVLALTYDGRLRPVHQGLACM